MAGFADSDLHSSCVTPQAVLGLAIVRRLDLCLAIELDQQIAAPDARARLHEMDDNQRARLPS